MRCSAQHYRRQIGGTVAHEQHGSVACAAFRQLILIPASKEISLRKADARVQNCGRSSRAQREGRERANRCCFRTSGNAEGKDVHPGVVLDGETVCCTVVRNPFKLAENRVGTRDSCHGCHTGLAKRCNAAERGSLANQLEAARRVRRFDKRG